MTSADDSMTIVTPETAPLIAEAVKFASARAAGPAKQAMITAVAALSGYGPQLQETHRRVSTFKSFADPSKPVPLLDHYVTTIFHPGDEKDVNFDQDELLERLLSPQRLVISATAGFGKSMAMRFLALALYENPRGKIPLFVELRHLNRVTSPNLIAFVHQSYAHGSKVALESLRQGMRSGAIVLLLDGFDELSHEIRPTVETQILEIARDFPEISIVVSGRPDERFKSWRDFGLVKICPMSLSQIVDLLTKLDYEVGVKRRFIKKVQNGLYETHKSFLSTPLLAILMLLTYQRNSNIPEKLHLFYAKAFETLFEKHDATKEQHERARKTILAIDQFQTLFATFCLNSYVREMTEFEHAEIIRLLRESIKFQGLDVDAESFLFDIEESVCLMMREGGSFFFIHRSFQEYFTALFLSQCSEDIRDEFLDSIATRHWDNVLSMLFEMSKSQLEPSWISRKIDEYLNNVGRSSDKISPLLARFSTLVVHRSSGNLEFVSLSSGPYGPLMTTLRRFYPELVSNQQIDFKCLEEFVRDSAAGLRKVAKRRSRTTNGVKHEWWEVPLSSVPATVLRKSGFPRLADTEFKTIEVIAARISKEEGARGKFLEKLFASS